MHKHGHSFRRRPVGDPTIPRDRPQMRPSPEEMTKEHSMSDWYWMKNGEKHGPVHTAGLKELARTGQLLPTDMIWCERLRNWVPASQTKGLEFGASGSTHADRSSEAVSTTSTRTPVAQRQATPRGPIKYRCARCGRLLESRQPGRQGGHLPGVREGDDRPAPINHGGSCVPPEDAQGCPHRNRRCALGRHHFLGCLAGSTGYLGARSRR